MAKIQLHTAFKQVCGKLNKRDNTILRQKKYRADNGKVIGYGAQEGYEILNPRDYKKNPPKGTELANITSFAQASRQTTLLIQAGKYTDEELAAMPDDLRAQTQALRSQLAQFKARFNAQLVTPDPQAPILDKTDPQYNPNSLKVQRRRYRTLNTFIRAILLQSIRTE
jgi:hypothetical protein